MGCTSDNGFSELLTARNERQRRSFQEAAHEELTELLLNARDQIRDLQQALRTERDARKAAEEGRDGYRKLYERAVGGAER